MKIRLFLAALVIAFISGPLVHADEGKDTPLEKEMKAMNRAFRQLKKQAGDAAQNASSLALVAQMEKAAAAAAGLTPAKAADLPEKDRDAFEADFKAKMQKFSDELAKVEAAFKAGDNAAAAKLVADLGAQERAGHKEFRKPQD
ncbi:MAG TPA: cytochrome b562 [Rariglobus sp.]|jgi:cytochrome c556|nr:cytochrome b562 [Rariglobus sp.]